MIAIVDYGMGNRRSVEKALAHIGAPAVLTASHDPLRTADALVLPGVGAFPEGMRRLRAAGLHELLAERVEAGVPLLGICLGMQLLFERSSEHEGADGLGFLRGEVRRLRPGPAGKLPHIGWNRVTWRRESPLAAAEPTAYYHVHSYVAEPADSEDVVGTSEYGETFASVVQRGSVAGTQFHPEKSSLAGLALLRAFAAREVVAA